jgi:hypothetical protein
MATPGLAEIDESHARAWAMLAAAGDWFTGEERTSVAHQVRAAQDCFLCAERAAALSPTSIPGIHPGESPLSPIVADTVHRVTMDAKRLSSGWADGVIAEIGEGPYVELIGLVSSVMMLDMYRTSMGEPLDPLPSPIGGEPRREIPADVGDVGAWVSQTIEKRGANVSRALSLVPATEALFVTIESWQYSARFKDLVWDDRALSRPQTELVAATVAAMNECFY